MRVSSIISLLAAGLVCTVISPVFSQDTVPRAFVHKVIFSDAPDMGKPWRGGLRTNDILEWDFFLNVKDWLVVDFMWAGIPEISIQPKDTVLRDSVKAAKLKDRFLSLSFKSKPFFRELTGDHYALAAGLKLYGAEFKFWSGKPLEDTLKTNDGSAVFFLTQRGTLWNRLSLNLYTSISLDTYGPSFFRIGSDTETKSGTSVYFVPAAQIHLGRGWYFGLEYYLTNSMYLPIEIIQIGYMQTPMENLNQDWLSFMVWGFQYRGKHLWAGVHLFNHWSFQGPVIPMLGIGVNF